MLAACGALVSSEDDAPDEPSGGEGGDGPDAGGRADGGRQEDGPAADGGADALLVQRCDAALFCETFDVLPATEHWTRTPASGGGWSETLTEANPRSPPTSLLLTRLDGGAGTVVFTAKTSFDQGSTLSFSVSVRVNDANAALSFFKVRGTGASLGVYQADASVGLALDDDVLGSVPISGIGISKFHEWTIAIVPGGPGPTLELRVDGNVQVSKQLLASDGGASVSGPFTVEIGASPAPSSSLQLARDPALTFDDVIVEAK